MKLKELKKRYSKAVKEGVETFFADGKELVVGYAKYVIQYAESKGADDNTEITLVPVGDICGGA